MYVIPISAHTHLLVVNLGVVVRRQFSCIALLRGGKSLHTTSEVLVDISIWDQYFYVTNNSCIDASIDKESYA